MNAGPVHYSVLGLEIRMTGGVLDHFDKYRQRRWYHREAGGQLFAKVSGNVWQIAAATGPRPTDKRKCFGYSPDERAEQAEIYNFHAKGLEYVGDWHTHPQDNPRPSSSDLKSIDSVVRRSTHHFPGFLLCIIGRFPFPQGLWVSFHDRKGMTHGAVIVKASN